MPLSARGNTEGLSNNRSLYSPNVSWWLQESLAEVRRWKRLGGQQRDGESPPGLVRVLEGPGQDTPAHGTQPSPALPTATQGRAGTAQRDVLRDTQHTPKL